MAYQPIENVPLDAHGRSGDLEIHKLADGPSKVIALVGPETLERLRHGLSAGEKLTIYTDAWKEAPNLVPIPISRIRCERARILEPDERYGVYALDCRIN